MFYITLNNKSIIIIIIIILILISPFFELFNLLGNSIYVPPHNGLKIEILIYSPFIFSIVQVDPSSIQLSILYKTSYLLRPYLFVLITIFAVELK